MLSCKDVTRLISESMDTSLPIGKRIGMRLHLLMCKFCSRYERQLLLIRDRPERRGRGDPKRLSGGLILRTDDRGAQRQRSRK